MSHENQVIGKQDSDLPVMSAEGGCSTMAMPPPSFLSRTISSVRMGSKWQKMGGSGGLEEAADVTLPPSG